ncbi:MAG: aminotransferase [Pseudomonadota bacterium]
MKPIQLTNAQARDVETLVHPYTNLHLHKQTGPQMLERGEGIYVFDESGQRFIEGMSGLWCAGLGYNNAELIDAATEQMHKLPYYHLFGGKSFEPAVALAEKLKELFATASPDLPMARVFFASSGSEANDTQVKLAWYFNNAHNRPKKKRIISRVKGYHGVTIVSASLTGLPNNHRDFDLPVDGVMHAPTPHYWRGAEAGESEEAFVIRMAEELDAMIQREDPDTIAAMIAEPVMGAGGVIIPPTSYFPAIQAVLDRYDIRLIDDEVICGFGRTGEWFGAGTLGMRPHSASFAKQMTSAYVPLSAVAIDSAMEEALDAQSEKIGIFGHGFTYGGHPVGCAVALKAIEIYERMDVCTRVRRLAPAFAAALQRHAEHPLVGEARSIGLVGALELAPDKSGKTVFNPPMKVGPKLMQEMLARGVIVRAIGDTLAFCPPMIIEEDEIDALFEPLGPALDATYAWAKAEGYL